MNRDTVINQAFFQLSWPACVIGAAYSWLWAGVLVVGGMMLWQLQASRRHRLDVRMLVICLPLGFVMDSAWIQLGLLDFAAPWPSENFAPLWILLLWIALALVINHSLSVFKSRLLLIGVIMGIGSPLSYYAGSRFGAVEWVAPAWQVILATGLSWALIVPLLFWLARGTAGTVVGREVEMAGLRGGGR